MKIKSIKELYTIKSNENFEWGKDTVSLTGCEVSYTKPTEIKPYKDKRTGEDKTFPATFIAVKDGVEKEDSVGVNIAGDIKELKGEVINISNAKVKEYLKDGVMKPVLNVGAKDITIVSKEEPKVETKPVVEKPVVSQEKTVTKEETEKTVPSLSKVEKVKGFVDTEERRQLRIARENATMNAVAYLNLGTPEQKAKVTLEILAEVVDYLVEDIYYKGMREIPAPEVKEVATVVETKVEPAKPPQNLKDDISKVVTSLIESGVLKDWTEYITFLKNNGYPKYKDFLDASGDKKLKVYQLLQDLS